MLIRRNDLGFFLLLVIMVFVFFLKAQTPAYLLCFFSIFIFHRKFTKRDYRYLLFAVLFCALIFLINNFLLNNYLDFSLRGSLKLFIFFVATIVANKLLDHSMNMRILYFRAFLWVILFCSIAKSGKLDSWDLAHSLLLFSLFCVEYILFSNDRKNLFWLVIIIILVFTKKQLILSCFLVVFVTRPRKAIVYSFIAGIFLLVIMGIASSYRLDSGKTIGERYSYIISDRFFQADPSGNFRLFLLGRVLPEVVKSDKTLFGFGLERFGNNYAYQTGRDIESNELGLGKFLSEEYSDEGTGSYMADVGLVTIIMQLGLSGLFYYFMIFKYLKLRCSITRLFIVLLPFILGGPLLYMLAFPFIISLVALSVFLVRQEGSFLNARI